MNQDEASLNKLVKSIKESFSSIPVCDRDFKCPGMKDFMKYKDLLFLLESFKFCPWGGQRLKNE